MEDDVSVQDLISLSYDQKPVEFEKAFNSLMTDRLAGAIEDRKAEIAQATFGGPDPEDADEGEPEDLDTTELEDTPEEPEDGETA